ncbi:MAG: class I SAM-dependent methyltransferase [Deltaproteobacteria bacterium]|nr:class I SAM-dependent methyltransferase [Deltaproteobacteria bacterium]
MVKSDRFFLARQEAIIILTPPDNSYERKKTHYRSGTVATDYDSDRWANRSRLRSNRRKLAAIDKAIALANEQGRPVRSALDLPCGTGRIFPLLLSHGINMIGSDLSLEMMKVARSKFPGEKQLRGFVQCDAEHLPYATASLDAVFSIRFFLHLPGKVRQNALKEMARVSRCWLIVDYRHRYTFSYWSKTLLCRIGLGSQPPHRVSSEEIAEDFRIAGAEIVKIFSTSPVWSDKWVILGRKN